MQDDSDLLACLLCGKLFERITPTHLKKAHSKTMAEYRNLFPAAQIYSERDKRRKSEGIQKVRIENPEKYREWGDKISKKLKGKPKPPRTAEHSRKISEAKKGKTATQTVKLKESYERRRGVKMPPSQSAKLRQINLGKRHSEETKKRISQNRRGITPKRTPEGIANMPRGERHYKWKGGVNPEYGGDWPRIAHGIRLRDKFNCQFCDKHNPKGQAFPVHHIIPVRDLQARNVFAHAPENLVTLCWSHHKRAEDDPGWSVPYYRALLIEKYGYKQEFYDELDAKLREAV